MKLLDKWLGDGLLRLHVLFRRPKRRHLPKKIERILVIKLIAMGDLIVITPLVRTLRKAYPNAKIDLLATPRVRSVVEPMALYDNIIYQSFGWTFPFQFIANIMKCRREKYDLVLDLEFYYRLMTLFCLVIDAKFIMGFDLQKTRSRVMDLPVAYYDNIHVVDAFLKLASALGIVDHDQRLEPLHYTEQQDRAVRTKVPFSEYILVHVGTSVRAKSRRWEEKKWTHLLRQLSAIKPVVLIGGNEEKEIIRHISVPTQNVVNLINKVSLVETAILMKNARLYIGLDTGPTHLAASMGCLIVALYGPNTPVRWGPYSKQATIIYKALPCSPCTRQHEGIVSNCGDNQCMKAISVHEVMEAVRKYI